MLKTVSAASSLTVASFEDAVIEAFEDDLRTSISDATGGGTVTATMLLRVNAFYSLPDDLSCADIVTAYATATGVAADSVSASCDPALRRSLLAQEVEITTTFSAAEVDAAIAFIQIDPISAMSVELGVEPTEIAQTAATVLAIDGEWLVAITDADTADLDTLSIGARISDAVDEVANGAGTVAETSEPVDVTPVPPPPTITSVAQSDQVDLDLVDGDLEGVLDVISDVPPASPPPPRTSAPPPRRYAPPPRTPAPPPRTSARWSAGTIALVSVGAAAVVAAALFLRLRTRRSGKSEHTNETTPATFAGRV